MKTAIAMAIIIVISTLFAACNSSKEKGVAVANLNILHGLACNPPVPGYGDQCRIRDRVDLLFRHIEEAGCPDIVTLQEVSTREYIEIEQGVRVGPLYNAVDLIKERLESTDRCPFRYHIIFDHDGVASGQAESSGRGIDEELMLSRYPVQRSEVRLLYSPLALFFSRHVLFARIEHPATPVDVFTTHFASGRDFGDLPCGFQVPGVGGSPFCPEECAVSDTVRECQAKQAASFVRARHTAWNPAILSGDFNARPHTKVYDEFAERGWEDSHLASGNSECDSATGKNCTSGRKERLGDLESPQFNVNARIDYIFVAPARPGAACVGKIQSSLFAALPNPFADDCGPGKEICWVSDHVGNIAKLLCEDRKKP